MHPYKHKKNRKCSCQTLNSSQLSVVGLGVGNIEDSKFSYL